MCSSDLDEELVDNAVDEAAAGFATRLDVLLNRDGSVEISDNGRGIPVDIHSGQKMFQVVVLKVVSILVWPLKVMFYMYR